MVCRALLSAAVLTLALTACSGERESGASLASSTTAATSLPPTTPVIDAHSACERFIGNGGRYSLLQRIPEILSRIGPELGPDTTTEIQSIHGELDAIITIAPADMAVHLRAVQLPFQQVVDVLANGGGQANIDTGAVQDAIIPLMEACADAGYRVSPQ